MQRTAMSVRELRRVEVFGRVASHTLGLVDAAEVLALSYRQGKRLWKRYREHGAKGLQHDDAGRPSHRAKPAAFREQVLRLIREKYAGSPEERFGPTLASEHLAEEDGLPVDAETLWRWMLAVESWSRLRGKRRTHRRRRARKEHRQPHQAQEGTFQTREQRGHFEKRFDTALGNNLTGCTACDIPAFSLRCGGLSLTQE